MATALIVNPYAYFPDPNRDKPLFNASIYIGVPDLDPRSFPKNIVYIEEDGNEVPAPNPVMTGSGGQITYNGKLVQIGINNLLETDDNYSIMVRDRNDSQVYYVPNYIESGGATVEFVTQQSHIGDSQVASGIIFPNDATDLINLGSGSRLVPAETTRIRVNTGELSIGEILYLWEPSGDFGAVEETITSISKTSDGTYSVTTNTGIYEFLRFDILDYRREFDYRGWDVADPTAFIKFCEENDEDIFLPKRDYTLTDWLIVKSTLKVTISPLATGLDMLIYPKTGYMDTREHLSRLAMTPVTADDGGSSQGNVFQGIAVDTINNRMFISQYSPSGNVVLINEMSVAGDQITNYRAPNAGHGLDLSYEQDGASEYIWMGGDDNSYFVHRLNWGTKALDTFDPPVDETSGITGVKLTSDKVHLLYRTSDAAGDYIYIFELADIKANASAAVPINKFKLDSRQSTPDQFFQGFASDDGVIYILTGNGSVNVDKLIYAYGFDGELLYTQQIYTGRSFAAIEDPVDETLEPEALEIYNSPNGTGKRMLYGMMTGPSGDRIQSIYGLSSGVEKEAETLTIDAPLVRTFDLPTPSYLRLQTRIIPIRVRTVGGVWSALSTGNPSVMSNVVKEVLQETPSAEDGITLVMHNRFKSTIDVSINPSTHLASRNIHVAWAFYAGGDESNNIEIRFYDALNIIGGSTIERLPANDARFEENSEFLMMLTVGVYVEQDSN